jgi:hypothetical protein
MSEIQAKNTRERLHLRAVAELGCIVCRNLGFSDSPAEIHHLREKTGMGLKSEFMRVIPLCHIHHRTGNPGVAFHAGREIWERKYGTQSSLLLQVKRLLEMK